MTSYIYLVLAILCSSGVALTLRHSQRNEKSNQMTLMSNYIVCVILCYIFMPQKHIIPTDSHMKMTLILGIINGGLYLLTLVINKVSIKRNGTPLTASFSHLGVLLPTLLSIVIFGEHPSRGQWVGVALAVIAIVVINFPGGKGKKIAFPMGLILLFIVGGCADMMSKVFASYGVAQFDGLFLFYTFLIAFILCAIWAIVKRQQFAFKDIIYGIILGAFNYSSTLFLLRALFGLPAFLVYPAYSVGVIVFINIVNRLFLKEKISNRQYVGMALICAALVFLNGVF